MFIIINNNTMKTTLAVRAKVNLLHVRKNSVLTKVRGGMPLYEVAGEMGISTADASDLMEAELRNEKKKVELQQKRAVTDLFEQHLSAEKIAYELNLPVGFVHKTIIQFSNRMQEAEKIKTFKKDRFVEENPDDKSTLNRAEKEIRNREVAEAFKKGSDLNTIATRFFLKPSMVRFILRDSGVSADLI